MKKYNKNDLVELEIIDFTEQGEGIGKIEGFTIFVKNTLIGDIILSKLIKVKKNYAIGIVDKFIKYSDYRTSEDNDLCGCCMLSNLDYKKELEYKENNVKELLKRVGKVEEYEYLGIVKADNINEYRNKASFPVREENQKIKAGFFKPHTHKIIDNHICKLQNKESYEIKDIFIKYMNDNKITAYNEETGKGLVKHLVVRSIEDKHYLTIVINSNKVFNFLNLESYLKSYKIEGISINLNASKNNVILSNKTICINGKNNILGKIGSKKYLISPNSFFQINNIQTKRIYDEVIKFGDLQKEDTVLDLFCGIGTISIYIADRVKKVIGVENVEAAIIDAKENAKINNVENVDFICGNCEDVVENNDKFRVNKIILDPARKGLDLKLIETIEKLSPEKIVYVSCNPATLARDIELFKNYKLEKVKLFDFFPNTLHVETICLLVRI